MMIDLSAKLLDLEGNVLEEVHNKKLEPITVRTIISNALQAVLPNDRSMGMVEKEKLFSLLLRVHAAPVLELEEKEINQIKDRVAQMNYSVLVVGQVLRILTGIDTGLVPGEDKGELP